MIYKFCLTEVGSLYAHLWVVNVSLSCSLMQVREINFFQEGDLTHFGQPMVNCNLQRVWKEVLEKCNYEYREREVEIFNRLVEW